MEEGSKGFNNTKIFELVIHLCVTNMYKNSNLILQLLNSLEKNELINELQEFL